MVQYGLKQLYGVFLGRCHIGEFVSVVSIADYGQMSHFVDDFMYFILQKKTDTGRFVPDPLKLSNETQSSRFTRQIIIIL